MEIRPIKSARDHEEAVEEIEALMNARAGSREAERLDVLVTLVDRYEEEHFPMGIPSPIGAIEFAMDQRGYTRKDLEAIVGTRARASEILNGRRGLSIEMIRELHTRWLIPLEALVMGSAGTRKAPSRKAARKSRPKSRPAPKK